MWHWQRKNQYNFKLHSNFSQKQLFLLKLCIITAAWHILFLAVCIFAYKGYHEHERFDVSLHNHHATLVLCPLQKKVAKQQDLKTPAKDSLKATKILHYDQYEQQKKEQEKQLKAKKTVEKHDQAEIVKKPADQKKDTVEKVVQKKLTKTIAASEKNRKIEKKEPAKQESNHVEKKQVAAEKKDTLVEKKQVDAVQAIDDVTFVGYEQLDSLMIQNQIQDAIQQYFKPPVGMNSAISCECLVQVQMQGKAHKVTVQKGSGVVAYDISARSALYQIQYPKEVRGKTITVVVGQ